MNEINWHGFYQSDLQTLFALCVVPVAFLAYRLVSSPSPARAVVPEATRFVALLTLFFAIETIVDPIATGPLLKKTFLGKTIAADLIPFLFVYLGDLRVLILAVGVARPDRTLAVNLRIAGAWALIVPIFAGVSFELIRWINPEAHGQLLWMLYEFAFFALSIGLGRFWVSGRFDHEPGKAAFLRSIFGYSAAYYALWFSADLLIVGAGLDLGWAIRIVPNHLYYGFWVPFVYWRFFAVPLPNAAR